jgi:hypothetical protein
MHKNNKVVAFVHKAFRNRANVLGIGIEVCIGWSRSIHGRQGGYVDLIAGKFELLVERTVALGRVPAATDNEDGGDFGEHGSNGGARRQELQYSYVQLLF